ncbi:rod shape-determining protein MreD [bacterium]|nr:rod shape-determining protein MreD [bacterium]
MNVIKNILIIALALLVQSTVIGRFTIFGVRPDLAMLVLLYLASTSESFEITLYGFLIGFLQDVYSPEYLGYNSLVMSLVGFALGFIRERITVERGAVRLFMTLLACLAHDLLYLTFYSHLDLSMMLSLFLRWSIAGALFTSVLSVVLMTVWEWIEEGGLLFVFKQLMGYRR